MADDTREIFINPYTDFGQKEYWDYTSTLETAERKGIQLGMFHEKIDTIHRLQSMGLSVEQIAQGADMKVDEVKKLLK